MLTLVFGAVIAVLLSALLILIFTRQTDSKDQREGEVKGKGEILNISVYRKYRFVSFYIFYIVLCISPHCKSGTGLKLICGFFCLVDLKCFFVSFKAGM